jgi:glycogen(starch) synthase
MPRDLSPAVVRSLRSDFRTYDVVHTHLVHADWHALVASAGRTAKWVSSKHNPDRFRTLRAFRAIERQVDRRADKTIAISRSLAEFTYEQSGVRPEVVGYGFAGSPVLERPVRERGPFSLFSVGRLVPQKGLDIAIRAMPTVTRSFPGTSLTIAGEGPDRAALGELARRLGVQDAVHMPGWVEDVRPPMSRHDVLVHPARWEGFGLVLLEAMAARLPIVASSAGAIPEVVGDEAGALVPPERPDVLARAICELLGDPSRRERLASAASRRLTVDFSMEAVVRRTAAIYRSAIGTPARGAVH